MFITIKHIQTHSIRLSTSCRSFSFHLKDGKFEFNELDQQVDEEITWSSDSEIDDHVDVANDFTGAEESEDIASDDNDELESILTLRLINVIDGLCFCISIRSSDESESDDNVNSDTSTEDFDVSSDDGSSGSGAPCADTIANEEPDGPSAAQAAARAAEAREKNKKKVNFVTLNDYNRTE